MYEIDYAEVYESFSTSASMCGDIGFYQKFDHQCLVALIDGLGHGKSAREAAMKAKDYIAQKPNLPLDQMIKEIHEHIKGTRGVVLSICRIDLKDGTLAFSGVGNITVKLFGDNRNITFVPKDGVVGYLMSRPVEQVSRIGHGDILILHSDGITSHFEFIKKYEWDIMSAKEIADEIFSKYKTRRDDSSCLVLKCL